MIPDGILNSFSSTYSLLRDLVLARCQAHDDKGRALALRMDNKARIHLECSEGCSEEQILEAVDLPKWALLPPFTKSMHAWEILEKGGLKKLTEIENPENYFEV